MFTSFRSKFAITSIPFVQILTTYWWLLLSCGLRHPMKLVPFATRVRMDVKTFPSRPSVPLLTTNSIVHH
ncbi:Receptor-type tyrosine-protein phosphatase [Trichinella spiralis]|uniref:Receptor-type tyrosine-protein phosphatase n=1 Tax=Trichinella spiralis TaxID=6334 RepID=A0ABR3KYA1_TRISP